MGIRYSWTKEFDKNELQALFRSVRWSSGNYPERLQTALGMSDKVVSAWDGDRLVGLSNALSDGAMTAYFHYLLVRPEYQFQGIGRALVSLLVNEYRDFARKVLIAYDKEVAFYEKCGFVVGEGKTPMFITFLTS